MKYRKLAEQGDPTLPGNVQAVDISGQIEDEGEATQELKEKEAKEKPSVYDDMMDDLW